MQYLPPPFSYNMGSHPTCLLASSVLIGAWRRARPLHATSRTSYLYRWLAKTSADQLSRKTYYHSFFYIVIPLSNSCYLCSSTRGLRPEKTQIGLVLCYLSLKEEHCTIQAKHFKFSRDLLPLHSSKGLSVFSFLNASSFHLQDENSVLTSSLSKGLGSPQLQHLQINCIFLCP